MIAARTCELTLPDETILIVDHEIQERIARNEAIFRDVNEAIQGGRWPGENEVAAFRCECGLLGCARLIEMTVGDYERVRANPRRFVVAVDHDLPEAEAVVERHPDYVVIEKNGRAGRLADATDPRS
jgi:hypothetical protein